MIARVLLSILIAASGVTGSWREVWQTGCESTLGAELLAVNPDARAIVYRRKARPGSGARSELVFRDLVTGEETHRHSIQAGTESQAAISASGEIVALLNQEGNHTPSDLAIWRPATDEWKTWKSFKLRDTRDVTEEIHGLDFARPAISPDARSVAFFADLLSIRLVQAVPEQSESTVLAVASLGTEKASVFPLPVDARPGGAFDWNLLWSADGRSIYAVVHHPYKIIEDVTGPAGRTATRTNEPQLELYKCVLGETTCSRLGSLPSRVYGSDARDNLIFASKAGAGGEGLRSFVGVPAESAGQLARPAAALAVPGSTVAAVGTDLLGNDGAVTSIAVGGSRTYVVLNARDSSGKFCQRLLERIPVSSP